MRTRSDHDAERERNLERSEEREPAFAKARRLPRRPMATRTRLADIMCGAADEMPTQGIEPETLAECAAYHREQLAKVGLVDDAGVLQPPVKLAGAA